MTIPDPTYITADEVQAQTLVTGLAALDDSDVEKLITIAEDQIDAYVGPQPHHYDDSNVSRVFPRQEDYEWDNDSSDPTTAVIPYKVSVACLRQVEWLYTQWWSDRATKTLPVRRSEQSKAIGADGSYSLTYTRGGTDFSSASLCDQARQLLEPFVARFVPIGTTDPDDVPPAT